MLAPLAIDMKVSLYRALIRICWNLLLINGSNASWSCNSMDSLTPITGRVRIFASNLQSDSKHAYVLQVQQTFPGGVIERLTMVSTVWVG